MHKATMVLGDTEFQKTLTERERAYIHEGCNALSKYSRELTIKGIRALGYTLDEIEALPQEQQGLIWKEANRCWNKQDWSDAKYVKGTVMPQTAPAIIINTNLSTTH